MIQHSIIDLRTRRLALQPTVGTAIYISLPFIKVERGSARTGNGVAKQCRSFPRILPHGAAHAGTTAGASYAAVTSPVATAILTPLTLPRHPRGGGGGSGGGCGWDDTVAASIIVRHFYLFEAVVIYSSPLWNNQVIVPCGVGLRLDLSRKRSCYILWSRKLSIDGSSPTLLMELRFVTVHRKLGPIIPFQRTASQNYRQLFFNRPSVRPERVQSGP